MSFSNANAYNSIPSLYDFEYPQCIGPELDFWDLLATQSGGPILELAVGTGRIALPLALLEHEVWGIDSSEPMLDRARAKISELPAAIGSKLHLHAQAMSSFELPAEFGLIYAPFNSFLLLEPDREAAACLECVHKHLKPDGKLVIDAFAPGPNDFLPDVEELTYLEEHPETGARVTRRRRYEYDSANSVAISQITYTMAFDTSKPQIYEFYYYLHLYTQDALLKYMKDHGFEVLEVPGDYLGHQHKQPEDNLILVCESSR